MPEPIATWNGARGVWERLTQTIFCEHRVPYSETWPTSVSMRRGSLYPPLTQERPTAASASSSSDGPPTASRVLPATAARDWRSGKSNIMDRNSRPLSEVIETGLLPTPMTINRTSQRAQTGRPTSGPQRGGPSYGLEDVLLPTPTAELNAPAPWKPDVDWWLQSRATRNLEGVLTGNTPMLKTPTAQLAVNGGSQDPAKRRAGGHGPTLADQVEHELPSRPSPAALLPTPRATDGTKGGPNQRGSSGDLMLPSVAVGLLPTPMAEDSHHTSRGASPRRAAKRAAEGRQLTVEEKIVLLFSGEPTAPPSPAGSPSSGGQHQGQLSLDVPESA